MRKIIERSSKAWISAFAGMTALILMSSWRSVQADNSSAATPEDSMNQLFEEESDQIVVSQMPFDMNLPSFGIGAALNEDIAPLLRPPFIQDYFDRAAGAEAFHSSRVIETSDIKIPEGIDLTFRPGVTKPVETWTADVIDSRGALIKEWKGKGAPPDILHWDGTDEGWNRIQAGEPYNFVFDSVNKDGSKTHDPGLPKRFPWFSLKQNNSLIILIASSELLSTGGSGGLSDQGSALMSAVCDAITQNPNHPITVDVGATDLHRGQKAAEAVQEFLSRTLMQNTDEITTDVQVDPNVTEYVKIQVLGVVK